MDETIARLTAPGGMLETATVARGGVALPVIATAPPSLAQYFAHYCTVHRDVEFLVSGAERLTYGETYAAAERLARALVGRGIGRGDRVGVAARNSPAWIVTYMATLMAGGVATLLNGWWQADELQAALADVDCALIVADAPRAQRLAKIEGLRTPVVTLDDTLPVMEAIAPLLGGAEGPLPELTGDDLATILFTSGSTGVSKGALSDHRAVVAGTFSFLAQTLTMLGIVTADGNPPQGQPCTLLTIPLFHVTAEVPVFLQSFAMGRRLVLMPKWDTLEAMRLIERERVTYFIGVPLMSFEILNHPDRASFDLSSVTDFGAGGAPRPVEHVLRIDQEMGGSAPLIGYGLTETNAVGTGNWRSNYVNKPASCGRASPPLVEIAILDDAGNRLPQGARGEVAIRTVANIRGYWNRPEATAAAFTADGFFRSGDIGYLDPEGYLFIVDRKKDIIIRGGENISCQEVEAALYLHPAVREAAVFGLADERLGEVPAAVVWCGGEPVTAEALCRFLAEHIAAFKIPARIWIADAPLPRLGTEKIDKVGLKARYRAVALAA
ncbi:fatty acid--CoA ligase [Sphingomonas metalli]|uniref:Fatty acid--CoA ligase n=2 Tax=Sphingomonas metalli TaxID=1779358 RepID=A0A916WW89_9SPHN|nr:fatty acid--CoA ligase [Sphingomonas metalli]